MTQERSEANWRASYLGGDDDDSDILKSADRIEGDDRYDTEATDPSSWMAIIDNGSPGIEGTGPSTGLANADLNMNGVPDVIDYFSGNDVPGRGIVDPPSISVADGLLFSFTRDPDAFGIASGFEVSTQLGVREVGSPL